MYYIGLISGTSMDAVEGVLADFETTPPTVVAAHADTIPIAIRERLKQASTDMPLVDVMTLDSRVADLFASVANSLMQSAGLKHDSVTAIGSHGQTLWHAPAGRPAWTLQIGDPNRIAFGSGLTTVADFRRMDMAAGGEGAPLAPLFHDAMFRGNTTRVVLNLGGIANITILPANASAPVSGFDTGPANTLLDAWAWRYLQEPCDRNGAWAADGRVIPELLRLLLADPYFQQPPPKSTGPEYFNLDWFGQHIEERHAPADVQATLVQLTAESVATAVGQQAPDCREVIACGGGVNNPVLMRALADTLSPRQLTTTSRYDLPPDKIEALCFAWLARERLAGRTLAVPAITGADQPVLLGGIYQPY